MAGITRQPAGAASRSTHRASLGTNPDSTRASRRWPLRLPVASFTRAAAARPADAPPAMLQTVCLSDRPFVLLPVRLGDPFPARSRMAAASWPSVSTRTRCTSIRARARAAAGRAGVGSALLDGGTGHAGGGPEPARGRARGGGLKIGSVTERAAWIARALRPVNAQARPSASPRRRIEPLAVAARNSRPCRSPRDGCRLAPGAAAPRCSPIDGSPSSGPAAGPPSWGTGTGGFGVPSPRWGPILRSPPRTSRADRLAIDPGDGSRGWMVDFDAAEAAGHGAPHARQLPRPCWRPALRVSVRAGRRGDDRHGRRRERARLAARCAPLHRRARVPAPGHPDQQHGPTPRRLRLGGIPGVRTPASPWRSSATRPPWTRRAMAPGLGAAFGFSAGQVAEALGRAGQGAERQEARRPQHEHRALAGGMGLLPPQT